MLRVANDDGLTGQLKTHLLVELSAYVPVKQDWEQDFVELSAKYPKGHNSTHILSTESIQLNFGASKVHLSRHILVLLSPYVPEGHLS